MSGISYELFSLDIKEIPLFQALIYDEELGGRRIEFTYEQAKLFPLIRKRNTLLFEQLAKIRHIDLNAKHAEVITDFLFDLVFLDLGISPLSDDPFYVRTEGGKREVAVISPSELRELLYKDGFRIVGVPKAFGRDTEELVFRPFVASASMARKAQYLFVRAPLIRPLMERLSLGLISYQELSKGDKERHFCVQGLKPGKAMVSVSKLAAYLGLSLSDGQTMRELRSDFAKAFPETLDDGGQKIRCTDFSLDEKSVVCLDQKSDFLLPLEELGPYVWKTGPWAMKTFSYPLLPWKEEVSFAASHFKTLIGLLQSDDPDRRG